MPKSRKARSVHALPFAVVGGAAGIWAIAFLAHAFFKDDWSFPLFMDSVIARTLSIVLTLAAAVLVAYIPSRLEETVQELSERIQAPLEGFDQLFHSAEQLLKEMRDSPESSFLMVSSSPLLGIELDKTKRDSWRALLASRIEKGQMTRIVCLDGYDRITDSETPIRRFCRALSLEYLKDTAREADIVLNAVEAFERFRDDVGMPNFELRVGGDPPFQLILADDSLGHRRGILYFSSTATLTHDVPVSGFVTEDERTILILRRLYDYIESESQPCTRAKRSRQQVERDLQLLGHYLSHPERYTVELHNSRLPFVEWTVFPEVFPPDIGLGVEALITGIDIAARLVWEKSRVPSDRRVVVDVGCGTGVLGLSLHNQATRILLIDNDANACENARENVERFGAIAGGRVKAKVLQGNLLEPVLDRTSKQDVLLIVFNHPYYPSHTKLLGTGGEDGGNDIMEEFLDQALVLLGQRSGWIVVSHSEVAGAHKPLQLAKSRGFSIEELSSSFAGTTVVLLSLPA